MVVVEKGVGPSSFSNGIRCVMNWIGVGCKGDQVGRWVGWGWGGRWGLAGRKVAGRTSKPKEWDVSGVEICAERPAASRTALPTGVIELYACKV